MNWGPMVKFLRGGATRTFRCKHCRFKQWFTVAWDYVREHDFQIDYFTAQADNHPSHRHPDWDDEVAS